MKRASFIILASAWGVMASAQALAFECDKGIVEIGDSKFEVSSKCGEPTLADHYEESRVSSSSADLRQDSIAVDEWLYNRGPHRFVMLLRFEQGKLVGMKTSGYGRARDDAFEPNASVAIGDPAVRFLFVYGPPSYKEERNETSVISRKDGAIYPEVRLVREWTYNLGPSAFLRLYRFINGKLVSISTGARGF